MSTAAGQNTLEFFLRLNVEAFKEGVRAAVGVVSDLSTSASKGAREIDRTGQSLDKASVSSERYARATAEKTKQTLSWNAALGASRVVLGTVIGLVGSLSVLGGAIAKMGEAERAAFNLETSLNAAQREFGDQTGSIASWELAIERLSKKLRVYSEAELTNASARTVDMTKRLGLSAEQMEQVVALSGDLAAGKTDLVGAVERVTAALRGEAESAEYLGLTLNENYVKAWHEAHNAHGVAWKDLSDIEKAQVRYNVFLEQSLPLQGKAAESVNTWSGALQLVQATIDDSIGKNQDLIRAMQDVAAILRDNSGELGELASAIATTVGKIIEFIAHNHELLGVLLKYGAVGAVALKVIFSMAEGFMAVHAAAKLLLGTSIISWFANLRGAVDVAAASTGLLATAFRVTLAGAAAYGVFEIGKLLGALYEWKKASDDLARAQKEARSQKDWIDPKIASRLAEVNRELGTQYRSMEEVFQAQKEGRIVYDQTTGAWVRGAAERSRATQQSSNEMKQATGDALKEMQKQYADHVKAIRRLQGQIADDERSLAAQLRDISREGMSEGDAYRDRINEAKEYQRAAEEAARSAQEAFARGEVEVGRDTFKVAIDLAKQAKDAYAGLASEVKEGDQVIVAQQDGLRTKLQGVKQAGEQAIALQKRLQEAEIAAANELKKKAGGADLTEGLSAAEKQWVQSFQGMSDSGAKAVETVNDEIFAITKTITVVEQDFRKKFFDASRYAVKVFDDAGREIVDSFKQKQVTMFTNTKASQQGFADGGTIPGHSPHERADNIGIPVYHFTGGEHVQPVRRVIEYGRAVFEQFRHGRFPRELAQAGLQSNWRQAVLNLPSIRGLLEGAASALPLPVAAGDVGADAGKVVNINITMPSGDAYQLQTDSATAARMERERERWFTLRSSNKVKRSGYVLTR